MHVEKDCDLYSLESVLVSELHCQPIHNAEQQDQFKDSELQRENIKEEEESEKVNAMVVEKNLEIQALITKVREAQAKHQMYKKSVQEIVPILSEKICELVAFVNENVHMEELSSKKLEKLKADLQDLTIKLGSVANSEQIPADEERKWENVSLNDESMIAAHHIMEDILLTKQRRLSQWLQETSSIPPSVDDSGWATQTYEPSIASEALEPHSEELTHHIAMKQEELARKEEEIEITRIELQTLHKQLKLQKSQQVEKRMQSVMRTSRSTGPSISAIHDPHIQMTSSDIRLHTAGSASVRIYLLYQFLRLPHYLPCND